MLPPIPVQWWSGTEAGAYHSICQTPTHLCKKKPQWSDFQRRLYLLLKLFWHPQIWSRCDGMYSACRCFFLSRNLSHQSSFVVKEIQMLQCLWPHLYYGQVGNAAVAILLQECNDLGENKLPQNDPPRLQPSMSGSHLDGKDEGQQTVVFCLDHILDSLKPEFCLGLFWGIFQPLLLEQIHPWWNRTLWPVHVSEKKLRLLAHLLPSASESFNKGSLGSGRTCLKTKFAAKKLNAELKMLCLE